MPDYQEMYLIMMRAAEKAIRILIEAQQACEELAMEEDALVLVFPGEKNHRLRKRSSKRASRSMRQT